MGYQQRYNEVYRQNLKRSLKYRDQAKLTIQFIILRLSSLIYQIRVNILSKTRFQTSSIYSLSRLTVYSLNTSIYIIIVYQLEEVLLKRVRNINTIEFLTKVVEQSVLAQQKIVISLFLYSGLAILNLLQSAVDQSQTRIDQQLVSKPF